MIYITSDIHGYPLEKFQALLKRASFGADDSLFVLGDVIDRNGDGGVAMLRWMMAQPNIKLLLGNHEASLLACRFVFSELTDDLLEEMDARKLAFLSNWMKNGAQPTLAALKQLQNENPAALNELLDDLREAPLYDTVSLPVGDFLLVHSGLGHFEKGKPLSAYAPDDFLWHRPDIEETYFDDVTTIFGHTPTQYYGIQGGKMLRTKTWIDIDTGAAMGGSPMLLRLDDMREFY